MENKKMTKKEMFAFIAETCADNAQIVEFCNHEIELLSKRVSKKSGPTKTQKENAILKETLKGLLTDELQSIKEIGESSEELKELSSQKISALLNQMVKAEEAVKVKEGKTVKFKRAE